MILNHIVPRKRIKLLNKASFLFLILIQFDSFGQEKGLSLAKQNQLDSIYVQMLNDRLDSLSLTNSEYIELNEVGKRIARLNVSKHYRFLTNSELIDLSIKKKETIPVLRLTHNAIGVDTIDVNTGFVNVTGKRKIYFNKGLRFKKGYFGLSCKGTNGYVPDRRFVFNNIQNRWLLIK